MDNALDLRTDGELCVQVGSACRFDSQHGRFFILFMMMEERHAAAQASAGMSAANVGASK